VAGQNGEKPKHIAVFAPDMAGGGAERAALQLAAGLADRANNVDLVLAKAKGPLLGDIPATVRLVDLGARRVLTSVPHLARYLRQERPDAIASVLDHANIAALLARRLARSPAKTVVIEQNQLSENASNGSTLIDRLMPRLANRFYPWSDAVVAVSAGVRDDLVGLLPNVPRDRFRVIYNPIVTDELLAKAEAPVDHPFFTTGEPVFVAVGRFREQKDFPTLIKAFGAVRAAGRQAKLLILGEGTERGRLERLVTEMELSEDVSMPGFLDNPYAYLARARAFVLSSRWEGLPTVVVEALCCGAPVVATDCPSGPREILANGDYGTLVPVGNPAALSAAMIGVLDALPSRPPEASWHPYRLDAVIDEYLRLLTGAP
jgi:glycosyltransferase involved in cell wall biosynthesis